MSNSTTYPAYDLAAVRAAFPITQDLTYLNHASVSPIPLSAAEAQHRATERMVHSNPGMLLAPDPATGETIFMTFSRELAELINAADPREIVGATSTSSAINTVAQAIDWQPGDNLLFCDIEFPSNAYPWMRLESRGVEVRIAPNDNGGGSVAAFEPFVDDNTRLIAVSALQFFTGHRADLAALGAFCHERDILFAVDAIQCVGHMPIDVQALHIDMLASGGQKSLMGPMGQGFLYVREAAAAQMHPAIAGPNAVEGWEHWLNYDLTPRRAAWRFMQGTPNIAGMFALVESVRFLRDLGREHIDAWTRHLTRVLIDELSGQGWHVITPRDPAQQGSIVTFRVGDPADPAECNRQAAALVGRLEQENIIVTKHLDARGVGHVRISTHCYNTEDEVRRVGKVLEEQN